MLDASARIALACEREGLEKRIDTASTDSLYAASIVGWDFTNNRSAPDPVNFGVWRTALLLSGFIAPKDRSITAAGGPYRYVQGGTV